jgi:hypothetical protein
MLYCCAIYIIQLLLSLRIDNNNNNNSFKVSIDVVCVIEFHTPIVAVKIPAIKTRVGLTKRRYTPYNIIDSSITSI